MQPTNMLFVLILLLIASCTGEQQAPFKPESSFNDRAGDLDALPEDELYRFPVWLDGCDRFRPIFADELESHPLLDAYLDLELLYALVYQESLCQTREELREQYAREDRLDDPGWQGGIMQVDSCFRWGAPRDCTRVHDQIRHGIDELAFSLSKVVHAQREHSIDLSDEQVVRLFLLGYNRGYYVAEDAIGLLAREDDSIPATRRREGRFEVFVNCTEKDRCMDDLRYLDITEEWGELSDDFERALLIACKANYGSMHNEQGDYCTGPGYGFNYPESILRIYDDIHAQQEAMHGPGWSPAHQKEFYAGDLRFANRTWFIKTSFAQTGPGPNRFYSDNRSVFVDEQGRLHLTIQEVDDEWYSSEVVLTDRMGYGSYTIAIEDLPDLHPDVVFGFFTYDLTLIDDPGYFHREIDFEIARWGYGENKNAQFVLQGPIDSTERFSLKSGRSYVVGFNWSEQAVSFTVYDARGRLVHNWTYTGTLVPGPGEQTLRLNLWLYRQQPGAGAEIVISDFSYEGE